MPAAGFWAIVLAPQMHFFRMRVPIFLICLILSLTSFNARAANARSGQVTHIILFWLKRPGNVDDQNVLLRGLRTLRRVRGVNDVRVGRPLLVDRPGLEQSFDLGVVVIFRDREALEKFERDPRRGGALDAMLQQLVRRYTVYNFANE
jgi:Stress responsive A/B Barrel Domain